MREPHSKFITLFFLGTEMREQQQKKAQNNARMSISQQQQQRLVTTKTFKMLAQFKELMVLIHKPKVVTLAKCDLTV